MNGYVETEDLDAISEMVEDLEYDESDESDEDIDVLERRRRGRRFRTPPRTAGGGGLFKPRPQSSQYVTQTQLQAALARVGGQIKTNSDAIKTLNSRVATLNSDVSKQAAELKKEQVARKKETDGLKSELKSTRELTAILPLLSTPRSVSVGTDNVGAIPANTKVLVDSGNSLTTLLPFLLLGGLGGSSGSGSSGGGLGDSMLLPLVLILSQSGR